MQTDSSGLYFHRARYYHPTLRRFLNQDTVLGSINSPASMNRFAYANGNPVTAIDPFGLAAMDFINSLGSFYNNMYSGAWAGSAKGVISLAQMFKDVALNAAIPGNRILEAMVPDLIFYQLSRAMDAEAAVMKQTVERSIVGLTGADNETSYGFAAYEVLGEFFSNTILTYGLGRAPPAEKMLPNGMGIGIVRDGQVIHADLTVSTSHKALAAEVHVLEADGTLASGTQAIIWTVENGVIKTTSSINFPSTTGPATEEAVKKYLQQLLKDNVGK